VKDVRVSDDDRDPTNRFEQLYREHGDRLWRAVYGFTGDADLTDDAVAEAFTQAIRLADSIREPIRWIWRVAFRVAAGALKDRRRAVSGTEVEERREPEDLSTALDLERALATLSPNQRAAIVLHHYAGYRTREIADMIGSTPGAVRVHLTVGRRKLRRLLRGIGT
jgi:RNA polymerase sigma-70 factor (ECF subfamily)